MKELTLLMVGVLFVFMLSNFVRKGYYLEKVKSSVDGHEYLVRKLPDSQAASDRLAKLGGNLQRLVDRVRSDGNDATKRLNDNFDKKRIIEHMPGNRYVSHSLNKGEELSFCLRNADDDTFIDENTVTFVAIHELAHVMSVSNGHTPEFWKNMKYLLEKGSEIGIYAPVDYAKNPAMFCGMEINSTPYDFGGSKKE